MKKLAGPRPSPRPTRSNPGTPTRRRRRRRGRPGARCSPRSHPRRHLCHRRRLRCPASFGDFDLDRLTRFPPPQEANGATASGVGETELSSSPLGRCRRTHPEELPGGGSRGFDDAQETRDADLPWSPGGHPRQRRDGSAIPAEPHDLEPAQVEAAPGPDPSPPAAVGCAGVVPHGPFAADRPPESRSCCAPAPPPARGESPSRARASARGSSAATHSSVGNVCRRAGRSGPGSPSPGDRLGATGSFR
jgi:hypothetical protein